MSEETVEVPFGGKAGETATLLLAAAEELELDPSVVQVSNNSQTFVVPKEVQKKAGLDKVSDDNDPEESESKKPAKKTAAKKAEK